MDDMNAFERQVAGEVVRASAPPRSVDAAAVFTATQPPKWRFQSMFSAAKFVVAGAIVALFGGFLLAGVMTQPEEGSPIVGASTSPEATSRPIELPAEIPEGIESGTLDTPLGAARWVRLSGDSEALPDVLRPVPVPGGFISLDEAPHPYDTCPSAHPCQRLWFSSDLLEWAWRPLPVDAGYAVLTQAGGEYWLNMNGEFENENDSSLSASFASLWRSPDALEWDEVDLTALAPPPPAAIDWGFDLGTVTASGDAVLVPVNYNAQVNKSLLGLPLLPEGEDQSGESADLEALDDGSYRVLGEYGDEHARIRFEEIDRGVRVTDDATGAVYTVMEGIGMDFVQRWAASEGSHTEHRLALLRDGQVDPVELPGTAFGTDRPTPFGTDDGFMAFQPQPDGLIQTWTSPDGVAWSLGEILGDQLGEPTAPHGVWIGPEGLVGFNYDEDTGATEVWESVDGVEWEGYQPPSEDFAVRMGSGWVTLTEGLAFYPDDSGERTAIEYGPLRLKSMSLNEGAYGMAEIGPHTIAHSVYEGRLGQQRDHWIISFDELP